MGQSYHPTFIDIEGTENNVYFATPRRIFDSFSKLMEMSWWKNPCVNALLSILKNNPCAVAWVGDYADGVLPIPGCQFTEAQQQHFVKMVWDDAETTPQIEQAQFQASEAFYSSLITRRKKKGALVNHTKQTYYDLNEYYAKYIEAVPDKLQQRQIWLPHPLPLLTAAGNGQGGGDYYSKIGADKVGTWAFDTIEWSATIPDQNYVNETTLFLEAEN